MLGSNFSLMTSLFNDRDRSSFKYKFDHEHKLNPAKLYDAMYGQHIPFDRSKFPELSGTYISNIKDLNFSKE
jgi:hypothetical protein